MDLFSRSNYNDRKSSLRKIIEMLGTNLKKVGAFLCAPGMGVISRVQVPNCDGDLGYNLEWMANWVSKLTL